MRVLAEVGDWFKVRWHKRAKDKSQQDDKPPSPSSASLKKPKGSATPEASAEASSAASTPRSTTSAAAGAKEKDGGGGGGRGDGGREDGGEADGVEEASEDGAEKGEHGKNRQGLVRVNVFMSTVSRVSEEKVQAQGTGRRVFLGPSSCLARVAWPRSAASPPDTTSVVFTVRAAGCGACTRESLWRQLVAHQAHASARACSP